jgi:two-component system nitrogen regulation response regulator GlnG
VKDQLESLVNQMIEQGILFTDAVSEFEKKFIKRMLERTKGNHSKAAVALGIHRNTLSRKVEDLGLDHRPKRRSKPPLPARGARSTVLRKT